MGVVIGGLGGLLVCCVVLMITGGLGYFLVSGRPTTAEQRAVTSPTATVSPTQSPTISPSPTASPRPSPSPTPKPTESPFITTLYCPDKPGVWEVYLCKDINEDKSEMIDVTTKFSVDDPQILLIVNYSTAKNGATLTEKIFNVDRNVLAWSGNGTLTITECAYMWWTIKPERGKKFNAGKYEVQISLDGAPIKFDQPITFTIE